MSENTKLSHPSADALEAAKEVRTHELKVWPKYGDALDSGVKTFEYRKDDREPRFEEGDILRLREWGGHAMDYTGREWLRRVTYIARGAPFPEGYCAMSIEPLSALGSEGDDSKPDVEWIPSRWWRVMAPDGSVWCETSDAAEARDAMRPGDTMHRLWRGSAEEWRPVDAALSTPGDANGQ